MRTNFLQSCDKTRSYTQSWLVLNSRDTNTDNIFDIYTYESQSGKKSDVSFFLYFVFLTFDFFYVRNKESTRNTSQRLLSSFRHWGPCVVLSAREIHLQAAVTRLSLFCTRFITFRFFLSLSLLFALRRSN